MAAITNNPLDHPSRILLVDDNSNGLIARKTVLEEHGYQVVTAETVEEALKAFLTEQIDLVVTDYRLPDSDGLALIGRVKAATPALPVILISGFVDALGLSEAGTGADTVIQKSNHEVPQLIRSVRTLLRRKTPKKPASQFRSAPPKKRRQAG